MGGLPLDGDAMSSVRMTRSRERVTRDVRSGDTCRTNGRLPRRVSGAHDSRVAENWSKGLTAALDPQVARSVAGHLGRRYLRHVPRELDRRVRSHIPAPVWSPQMAYAVGLLATDGCLARDRRHIAFTSNDRDLVESFLRCLGRPIRYRTQRTRIGNPCYQADFSDVRLYDWLGSVGLTPRKSLTLAGIDVPNEFLLHLVRGLIDGDGSIYTLIHAPTKRTAPNYRYERLWVYFNSASVAHIEWVRSQLERVMGLRGYMAREEREGRHPFFKLKFGKRDSIVLLSTLYADRSAPRLERKYRKWVAYVERNSVRTEEREPSRPFGQ